MVFYEKIYLETYLNKEYICLKKSRTLHYNVKSQPSFMYIEIKINLNGKRRIYFFVNNDNIFLSILSAWL